MTKLIDVKILKIFVGESAQHLGKPVHEAIVAEANQRGMAGASVYRGFMGFGASNLLHTAKILRLSEDLPIMIEIVDTPERIDDFLPVADAMLDDGSIVVQSGQAVFHLPQRIRDIMTTQVATVVPEAPLSQVAELLLRRDVKAVPVMDGRRVVGIITGGDLLSRAHMPLRLDMQCLLPEAMRSEHVRCLDMEGLRAKDIMTAPTHVVNAKTMLSETIRTMAKRRLKRLPVVADDGSLLGIVSRADILGALSHTAHAAGRLNVLPHATGQLASDIMTAAPTAQPDTPLADVLELIMASPLRRVVVVDAEGVIQGLIHDRDLIEYYSRRNQPDLLSRLIHIFASAQAKTAGFSGIAAEVMQREVHTVRPQTPLADVIQEMVRLQIKRIIVTDEGNRLLGIIDRNVLLAALSS